MDIASAVTYDYWCIDRRNNTPILDTAVIGNVLISGALQLPEAGTSNEYSKDSIPCTIPKTTYAVAHRTKRGENAKRIGRIIDPANNSNSLETNEDMDE
jgi:hypothetical protein